MSQVRAAEVGTVRALRPTSNPSSKEDHDLCIAICAVAGALQRELDRGLLPQTLGDALHHLLTDAEQRRPRPSTFDQLRVYQALLSLTPNTLALVHNQFLAYTSEDAYFAELERSTN